MGNFESHSTTEYGLNLAALDIDEAYVIYNSSVAKDTWIYSLTDECEGCYPKLQNDAPVSALGSLDGVIDTKFAFNLYTSDNSNGVNLSNPCSTSSPFGEYGIYSCAITTNDSGGLACNCDELHESADIYWPILCAAAFYVGLAALWLLLIFAIGKGKESWKRWRIRNDSIALEIADKTGPQWEFTESSEPVPRNLAIQSSHLESKVKQRVKAIDTFRGISITLMIFVNYGAGGYWFFDHAPWNGLTIADLLFPWFMWLMGVCIPISIRSLVKRKKTKLLGFVKILKRSCWLFVLGLGISNVDHIDVVYLRIFGVLQRFAFAYLIIATLHLAFVKPARRIEDTSAFRDISNIVFEWVIVLLIVMIHLLIIFFLEVPGCPKGYLGPGGRQDGSQYQNCTGGATGYVDKQILGYNHMYQNPTPKEIYDTVIPFDPEGILGILQSCFSVFLGLQGGMIIISFKESKPRIIRWLIWCIITGAIAALLCKCSENDGWIPINKNLWSVSYVLVTSCFGFFMLTVCYIVIDVLHWWNGAPFFYPGMNSILLYVGHQITMKIFPFQWYDSKHPTEIDTHGYKLVLDLWVTTVWVIIGMWLYSIKFFVAL